ncbi:MAG TPA: SAM-dependent methyltransferase, partial [Chloroflexota bacterium]|nr:SAM-dependent methyltransferase [Chloroflexota bacterium]
PPAGASATPLPASENEPPDMGEGESASKAPGEPEAPAEISGPDLRHNRRKEHPLPEGVPDPLLQALEIMDPEGRVRPGMRGKFTQVNEFLKLLEHSGALQWSQGGVRRESPSESPREADSGRGGEAPEGRPLRLLDGASGSSYLSFAAYHYLNDVRHIPATLVGVDVNEKLVAKGNALAGELGYSGIRFVASSIAAYEGEPPPDVVLALHACDTATDEAIARGIAWGSRAILAVPCCQHDLNQQLRRSGAPASQPFAPVLRHGILKERLADILTDAFRAHLLRLAGYDTDVVEFVSTEHSGRNLMIRAVRRPGAHLTDAPHAEVATTPADSRARSQRQRLAADYEALKALWGVTPFLETLLDSPLPGGGRIL